MKQSTHFNGIFTILLLTTSLLLSSCTKTTNHSAKITPAGPKIVFLGDSITHGYMGPAGTTKKNIPYWVDKELNSTSTNSGRNGATISGTRSIDALRTIQSTNLKKYNYCVLAYGINDYLYSKPLDDVKKSLTSEINLIRTKNSKLKIFAVLPLAAYIVPSNNAFIAGQALSTKNGANYTEGELCDCIKKIYMSANIPVLDWRSDPTINNANYKLLLGDQQVHPNQHGYQIIGKRIALFIESTRLNRN